MLRNERGLSNNVKLISFLLLGQVLLMFFLQLLEFNATDLISCDVPIRHVPKHLVIFVCLVEEFLKVEVYPI